MSILHISNQSEFETEVIRADGPVLVDFWASWCGPCKMLAPILDQLDAQYGDQVTIAKVDVDECRKLAMEYQVMSVPTLLLVKNGSVIDQTVGVQPLTSLVKMIQSAQ